MKLLIAHVRACYKASTLCGKSISGVGWGSQRRGKYMDLQLKREYQLRSHKEEAPLPAPALLGHAQMYLFPKPSLPLEIFSLRKPLTLHQSALPLQVFLTLFLSARVLLLLGVKTETFYGVYKPEVTQLNETICHIKFTSARIKRQIT